MTTPWFPSPLKWIPQPVTAVTLGIILNIFFQRYPELKKRLAELSGKWFEFQVEDLEHSFFMVVDDGGEVRIHTYSDNLPNVTMAGSSSAFLALLFSTKDPDSLFFARDLKLSGETDTGLHFKNILDNVEIDWEKELASFIGTPLAHVSNRILEQMKRAREQAWEKTESEFDAWMGEKGIPRKSQLETFQQQVNGLAEQSERLERSVSRVGLKHSRTQTH